MSENGPAIRRPSVDWHWGQPLWPLRPIQAPAWFVEQMTMWRCTRCGIEFLGDQGKDQLWLHMGVFHQGKPLQYTVYPPSVGLRPRGSDA